MNAANKSKANAKAKSAKSKPASASRAAAAATKGAVKAERKANKAANRARLAAATDGKGMSAEAVAIAASIIAPDAFPPKRFQDGYDAEPTAPFEPKTIADITFSELSGENDALGYPCDEQWIFAFRDPRRGVIIQNHENSGSSFYNLWNNEGVTEVTKDAGEAFEFTRAAINTGTSLHGALIYGGSPKDEASAGGFFPISYGDGISQTVAGGLPNTTEVTLTCQLSDGDDNFTPIALVATTTGSGTCTWSLLNGVGLSEIIPTSFTGYIRIDYASVASDGAAYELRYQADNSCFRHLTLGQFEQVDSIIDSFRANGLSLMFTNTVAEIQRSGDVVACQIPKSVSWPSVVYAGYKALEARPLAVPKIANDGIQIFWKPTAPFDMQFVDVGDSTIDSNYYSLNPLSDYLAICIRIPVVAGRAGKCQVHCNAEGRTASPWFGLVMDVPGERLASAQAMDFVRSYPQVHENPRHVSDMLKGLWKQRKGIGAVASALGAAIPGMAPLAGLLGAVSQI